MIRHHLKLKADVLPMSKLQRIWLTLDANGSGQLCSGEFGAFMRLGTNFRRTKEGGWAVIPGPPPGQGIVVAERERRAKLDQRASEVSKTVHADTVERARKVLLRDYQRAARAHESEAERLQQQLNRFLSTERKRGGSASGAAAAAGDSRPGTAATMPPTSARGVSPTALPNLAAAERGALSARIPRGRTTRSMAVGAQMAGVGLGG